MIQKASELVSPGEKAIVIFTRGDHFVRDGQGNGHTGNWVAGEKSLEQLDKVIIYLRKEETGINQVYAGEYAGWAESPEPGRKLIHFTGLRYAGQTATNWVEFGGDRSGRPVFYIM